MKKFIVQATEMTVLRAFISAKNEGVLMAQLVEGEHDDKFEFVDNDSLDNFKIAEILCGKKEGDQ